MSDLQDITAPADNTEGTMSILKAWHKAVGDAVELDEAVAELETDKVAMEIAAPAAGVIVEILKNQDEEVQPGEVMARMRPGAGASANDAATTATPPSNGAAATMAAPMFSPPPQLSARTRLSANPDRVLSPAVRRLVAEHHVDPDMISGSGRDGRVTRADVVAFIEGGGAVARAATAQLQELAAQRIPLDSMRRQIARHMHKSVTDAPHVTALFEADLSAIVKHRKAHKEDFAKRGAGLTYTAYFLLAAAAAMRAVPQVNSRLHKDDIEIFGEVNIGVGTALGDKGLVVPVVRNVEKLDLESAARALQDVTARAKDGKLKPEDVRGGTFSISNHGVSGSLLASPIIINQPQSAILGIGKMEKRVVVREIDDQDVIAIKPMAYVTLTIDHRVLDGHQTNGWMTAFVDKIESWR